MERDRLKAARSRRLQREAAADAKYEEITALRQELRALWHEHQMLINRWQQADTEVGLQREALNKAIEEYGGHDDLKWKIKEEVEESDAELVTKAPWMASSDGAEEFVAIYEETDDESGGQKDR